MRKPEHKQKFALTLLFSLFIFAVNTVVLLLSIAVVYMFTRLDIIEVTGGRVRLHNVLSFLFYSSVVIGVIITYLMGKISIKPFDRIISQLDRLAKGDFKARLHFGRPIGIHPTFRRVEKSFNRAAEELEHTEMLRSDFINNFSHEFKTPIVSIAGFAKLLRRGNLSDEQKEEYLAVIEEESLRLAAMANNVLSLTRVENQTILTDVTEFNLSEQIRSAVLLLADKWTAKNINMDIQLEEHLICGNEELLKQVWINLLDNAVKFSEPDGTVSVSASEDEKNVTVKVTNGGREIPQDSIGHIFNKFYQADESHSSEGNGIGLAIVKKVCDLHSGNVKAESFGGKTSFTVCLPKSHC